MPKLNGRIPQYRVHRHSGQAIVTFGGVDHYLGVHGSSESRVEYIRKEFGIEIARIILGHRSASATEIYAELDDEKAEKVMRKIG